MSNDIGSIKKKHIKNFGAGKELFLLSLPGILLFVIFNYIPMFGLVIAFKDFRYDLGFFGSKWIGLKNFEFLFHTEYAFRITRNTIVMNSIFITTGMIIQLSFALLLYELTRKAVKVYQTIMFFPYFLSWVVISYVFYGIFDMTSGLANNILKSFGMESIYWYNEPKYWPVLLTLAVIWKGAGYGSIIYYTALMGIDSGYYEAATLDGATRLQQVWYISIPFLKPVIATLLIVSIGTIFRADFGVFYQLPLNSAALYSVTDVIDTFVYRNAFADIGMGSAAGFYQSVVGFALVLISNKIIKIVSPENAIF